MFVSGSAAPYWKDASRSFISCIFVSGSEGPPWKDASRSSSLSPSSTNILKITSDTDVSKICSIFFDFLKQSTLCRSYIFLGDSHHLYMDQLLTHTIISGVYESCPELIIWEAVAIWANNSCSLQPCYEASCRYEEMVGRKMTHLHLVSCYDTIIRVRVLGPRNGRNETGPRGIQQDLGHLLGLKGSCSPDKNQVYPIGFLNKRRGGG